MMTNWTQILTLHFYMKGALVTLNELVINKLPNVPLNLTYFAMFSGVDFIKVGRKLQIIETALSICALRLRPTF